MKNVPVCGKVLRGIYDSLSQFIFTPWYQHSQIRIFLVRTFRSPLPGKISLVILVNTGAPCAAIEKIAFFVVAGSNADTALRRVSEIYDNF